MNARVLPGILDDVALIRQPVGQLLFADKNYYSREVEATLGIDHSVDLGAARAARVRNGSRQRNPTRP